MVVTVSNSCEMMLSQLLSGLVPIRHDLAISGIALDSHKVSPGDLFLAIEGTKTDGRHYIKDAIANGAIAIALDSAIKATFSDLQVPVFLIQNLKMRVGTIISRFFAEPSKYFKLTGVTGTNGKTSVTHLLAHGVENLLGGCAQIGTLGMGRYGHLAQQDMTTPDPITLQQKLAIWRNTDIQNVVMEVSSHALAQYRVDGVNFDVAILTNVTRDHLDYHRTLVRYQQAKRRLFEFPSITHAVLNMDDPLGVVIAQTMHTHCQVIGYSMQSPDIRKDISFPLIFAKSVNDTDIQIDSPWGRGRLSLEKLGSYHQMNLLASIAGLLVYEQPLQAILSVLASCPAVPGRMQCFGGSNTQPLVVVDYAHTPDALLHTLKYLRARCIGKLYCVFGCGGERDRGKRPLMGQIANQYADYLVMTNDNPRREDPKAIVNDIQIGIDTTKNILIELDRAKAINTAVEMASDKDIVLIAGKGHENYQEFANKRVPFSDSALVESFFRDGAYD